MGERRPEPAAGQPPGTAKLSPLQQAWAAYRKHTAGCEQCRAADGGRCEEALALWRRHLELCDEAYTALAEARRY
ncbi:hypothetical protein ACIPWE_38845 [Streptomyces sp. NPDC090073]|uniref:hypothetical protein n=1 Tax=Streptomyces sp. NPDC090073 TaxID=3365936 RepID=UPI003827C84E